MDFSHSLELIWARSTYIWFIGRRTETQNNCADTISTIISIFGSSIPEFINHKTIHLVQFTVVRWTYYWH